MPHPAYVYINLSKFNNGKAGRLYWSYAKMATVECERHSQFSTSVYREDVYADIIGCWRGRVIIISKVYSDTYVHIFFEDISVRAINYL